MEQKMSRRQSIRTNNPVTQNTIITNAAVASTEQQTAGQSIQNVIISDNQTAEEYLVAGTTADVGSVQWVQYNPYLDKFRNNEKLKKESQYFNIAYGFDPISENLKKQDKESEEKQQILTGTQQETLVYEEQVKAQKAFYEELRKSTESKKSSNAPANFFDEIPFPTAASRYKKNITKKNEEVVLNKNEELIINIEELADELANETLKTETNTLSYSELLNKYKELILKHERAKKQ